MNAQQIALSLVLATMVFSIALELKLEDFKRVAQTPKAVIAGLIPQFVLLPVFTWLATLMLDLPPNVEAAMLLVAACPGGSLSNVITHLGRGNTALSVSVSAVAALVALVATPFNFAWMVSNNPVTATWMRSLQIDPSGIWVSLLIMLAIPMLLGMTVAYKLPQLAAKLTKPLANFSLVALFAFIILGLLKERSNLTLALLPTLLLVIAHNASGLFLGTRSSRHHDRRRHAKLWSRFGHHRAAIWQRLWYGDRGGAVGHLAYRQWADLRLHMAQARSPDGLKAVDLTYF
jgi:bile acid:Na+ symporter, BASS family